MPVGGRQALAAADKELRPAGTYSRIAEPWPCAVDGADGPSYCRLMPTSDRSDSALALMIHNSNLTSWLVHVVGRVLAISTICSLAGVAVAAALDEWWITAVGVFVGGWAVFFYLNTASAPYPTEDVVELLEKADE